MKRITLLLLLFCGTVSTLFAQDVKIVTVVESIIPNGLGRSRMIVSNEIKDYKEYTTIRTETKGKDQKNKSKRGEIRTKEYEETKLLNFYNIGGIRFQNIAANDALVTSKITEMLKNGYELKFVNSGVEASAGKGDSTGIYVTRYIFIKK